MEMNLPNDAHLPDVHKYEAPSQNNQLGLEQCSNSPSYSSCNPKAEKEPLFMTTFITEEEHSLNNRGTTNANHGNHHEFVSQGNSCIDGNYQTSEEEIDETQRCSAVHDDDQDSSSSDNSAHTDKQPCTTELSSDSTAKNEQMCALDTETRQSAPSLMRLILESASTHNMSGLSTSSQHNSLRSATRKSSRCRKRSIPEYTVVCPNCSLSVRTCDLESHLHTELHKLEKLTKHRRSYDTTKRLTANSTEGADYNAMSAQTRYKQYLSIRTRRERRSRAKKKSNVCGEEESTCPVCNEEIVGTQDELAEHVDQCLKQQEGEVDLDVEGEENYEEYTWAGQTRIRATSLLEGGPAASGFTVAKRTVADEDESMDLDIDGDDCSVFGKVQYTEADLIPCTEEEVKEEKERKALRNAVLNGEGSKSSRNIPLDRQRWEQNNKIAAKILNSEDKRVHKDCETKSDSSSHSEIIESLKAKIKEQETQLQKIERPKCLICMDWYTKPLTSVQCWHVHCEECWLRTLGTKKLCPQCNMITSPSDLRLIYL